MAFFLVYFRMEYSVKDNRMKVFGVPLPNPFMRGAVANAPGPVPRPYMGRFEGENYALYKVL